MKHSPLGLALCLGSVLLAVRSLAVSPDPEKTRQLVAVVQSDATVEVRARALQQLALVATPEAVPALAALLADEKLGQYARDGLELLPDAAAADALRAALDRLKGEALIGVVNSLGARRDEKSIAALSRVVTQGAAGAAPAALVALGRIGTADAARVLEPSLARGSAELRAAAAEGCLRCADRAFDEGRLEAARALYALVRRADVPAPLRVTATRGAILSGGPGAIPLLLEQLRSDDPVQRDLALRTARDLPEPEVTRALVGAIDSLVPPLQALVLAVLVDRGGDGVLEAVEARAKAGNDELRVAAVRALGRIGRGSSVAILLGAARVPTGGPIADAALASLARIEGQPVSGQILQVLPVVDPAVRIRLIGVLGERKATAAIGEFMTLAAGTDREVSHAALRALGLISNPADLPRLIQLAIAMPDDAAKTLADRAVVTTAMKVLEPDHRADAVLRAYQETTDPLARTALLRPLGAIVRMMGGSHDVFFIVRAGLKDASAEVREAALRCLADWPDATPTLVLLELAQQPEATPAQRETALRGALRMAANVAAGRERSPLNALDTFMQANRAVRTKEEKMMLVSGLGSVKRVEAVRVLRPYLDDPDVKAEAALAIVQVAQSTGGAKAPGEFRDLLERIATHDQDEEVRRRAARLAKGGAPVAAKTKAGALASTGKLAPGMIFNGADLNGWDGNPAVWRVRAGTIVGGSLTGNPRNEFLAMTQRTRDFVLTLEYKLVGTEGFVNGGVQFRSVRVPQPPNEMSGYQADIGAGHSGCLYDESRRKKFLARGTDEQIKRLEKIGEWNRYEVRCVGPKVEITLNGERTVAYVEDDATVALEGLIALQIHGNCKAEIAFRNLRLEELP